MAVRQQATRCVVSFLVLFAGAAGVSAQPAEEPLAPELPEPAEEPIAEPGIVGEAASEPSALGEGEAAVAGEVEASTEIDAPEPEQATGGPDDDIVVTGSRIKRSSKDGAAAPLLVVDRKSLEQTGAADMSGLVAKLPVNMGAENNAGIGSGARGTAQFNLRGLGAGNTLVLLNGRRLLRSGLTAEGQNFDDVSQIPLSIVERVEVMKGGASAVYGSDAVAGVVNIITRKKYNGLSLSLEGNLNTRPGGLRDGRVSLTGGVANDTSGLGLTVSYMERTALAGDQRAFAYGDPSLPQWPRTSPIPATGIPAGYGRPTAVSNTGYPANYSLVYPSGLTDAMGNAIINSEIRPDPNCLNAPGTYLYNLPDVTSMPVMGANGMSTVTRSFGQRCGIDFTPYFNYVYPEKRLNVYSTLEHDFSSHAQMFGEFGFSQLDLTSTTSPSLSLTAVINLPKDYPDFPADWRAAVDATTRPIRVVGRTAGQQRGPMYSNTRVDNVRLVGGLRGDLEGLAPGTVIDTFNWEGSVTYQSQFFTDRTTDDIAETLQRSVNACSPSNAMNPAYQGIPCYHFFDTVNYANPAMPLNETPNAIGVTPKEYVQGRQFAHVLTKMLVLDAFVNGALFPLPGGDLGFALGTQLRNEETSNRTDYHAQLEGYAFNVGVPDWEANRSVGAAFVELAAPLFRGFELQGALRYEHYSDAGGATNPKVGLSFIPFIGSESALAGLKLRGALATSFRGPSLLQSYGRQVQFSEFKTSTGNIFRPQRTTGNPYLSPESSTAFNAGLEFGSKYLALEAEYWRYSYEDIVAKGNGPGRWTACDAAITASGAMGTAAKAFADANSGMGQVCEGVVLDDNGVLNGVNVQFNNAAAVLAQGFDVSANVTVGDPAAAGVFSFGANLAYMLNFKFTPTAGAQQVELVGSRNALQSVAPPLPNMRMTIPVSWAKSGHRIQLMGNWIGGFFDDANNVDIPSWFTLDVQYNYRMTEVIGDATTFTVGAINVVDTDPPFVQTSLGYEGQAHDARGRMLYARLTQDF